MVKKHITIPDFQNFVYCPFCKTKLDIDEQGQIECPCPHLDTQNYLTQNRDGTVDVWFCFEEE